MPAESVWPGHTVDWDAEESRCKRVLCSEEQGFLYEADVYMETTRILPCWCPWSLTGILGNYEEVRFRQGAGRWCSLYFKSMNLEKLKSTNSEWREYLLVACTLVICSERRVVLCCIFITFFPSRKLNCTYLFLLTSHPWSKFSNEMERGRKDRVLHTPSVVIRFVRSQTLLTLIKCK